MGTSATSREGQNGLLREHMGPMLQSVLGTSSRGLVG
jgi:hypothetical protein